MKKNINIQRDATELKRRYNSIAKTLDCNTTACDYHLRDLEIETACQYMKDGYKVLDIGCGLGYAAVRYASLFKAKVYGIDYSSNMIVGANIYLKQKKSILRGKVNFLEATVLNLPFENNSFDIVTSSRCLMALLDWQLQKAALKECHRVLKRDGTLVLMEGTFEGLEKLNNIRAQFGLKKIEADGRDRLYTLKFHEKQLLNFCRPMFRLKKIQRFGMYYLLTRVVQPLFVAPSEPTYDHKINKIAKHIARIYPDFEGIGHLIAFIFTKQQK